MKKRMVLALAVTLLAGMTSVCHAQEKVKLSGLFVAHPLTKSVDEMQWLAEIEEDAGVEVEWEQIYTDWNQLKSTRLSSGNIPDIMINATNDSDYTTYSGLFMELTDLVDQYAPNVKAMFEEEPDTLALARTAEGEIFALPKFQGKWPDCNGVLFINKVWLDNLGLEAPKTLTELKDVLIAFRDHAPEIQKEFGIEGSIIPMSCIVNDGDQDPCVLINGFGEGIGDMDKGRHIAVTDDKQVVCTATQEGFKKGIAWLHKLYEEGLIDPEAFTQEWSTYVSKGKSHRYGLCFSWDVGNIDNIVDFVPLPMLEADTKNLTPQNGSFTSGYDRGRCVVTAVAKNPALVCAWLDQMYDPFQSPQNNWGTYGEDDDFDIFVLGKNANGDDMLQHAPLGDASPVEVREAEAVGGPLAILDEYYGVYVTCPDDAQYRLDWIKDIYTPDMHTKYVFPNVFMTREDNEQLSNLQADITKCINAHKSDWIMNGFTDADWDAFQAELQSYKLNDLLAIFQKYLDAYYAEQ